MGTINHNVRRTYGFLPLLVIIASGSFIVGMSMLGMAIEASASRLADAMEKSKGNTYKFVIKDDVKAFVDRDGKLVPVK